MRRALATLFATAAGLAALLGYKTSPGPGQIATGPTASSTVPARQGAAPPATGAPPPTTARTQPTSPGGPPTTTTSPTGAPANTAPAPGAPPTTAAPGSGGRPSGTFTGPVVNTRYGPVQVEVILADGRLVDVRADELPVDRSRSAALSDRAAPILRSEALAAQGAGIDSVSGASITSRAYAQSLQAAIDASRG